MADGPETSSDSDRNSGAARSASSGGSGDPGNTAGPARGTAEPDTPVIQLTGAISLIDRFPALAGVDLEVAEGEIVLVRGPNGAGKSTLLRLCAGLAPLNTGTGSILGFDLTDRRKRRELRRQTGLLAHATFLYDELTIEENLLFWARANRIDPSQVEPVLDRLALNNRLRSVRVASLSAGQRRRASLAVLVCRRPRLWLLDEPHAGLDANGRDFVDGLIKHAIAFGATVLVASHDYDRAGDIATRTLVISGGLVQSDDGPVSPAPRRLADPSAGPRWEPAPTEDRLGPDAERPDTAPRRDVASHDAQRDRAEQDRGQQDRGQQDRGQQDRGQQDRGQQDGGQQDRGEQDGGVAKDRAGRSGGERAGTRRFEATRRRIAGSS